jgi:outer membrane protein insertion porin family
MLLLAPILNAQGNDSLGSGVLGVIDTVIVTGNEKTKEYVIRDEMTLRPGMPATKESVEFDRSRIYSLGLFNRVDVWYDTLTPQRALHVDVSERWYLIPLPIFGFAEGDADKPFYGAGLLHNNFRGRNQKLFGLVTLGYNPTLALSFYDPQIDRSNMLYFSADLSFSWVKNKSEREAAITGDFNERHYAVSTTIGKRLGLYQTLGARLGYQIVDVEEYRPGRTISPDGRDRFLFGSLTYLFDSRNLKEYATMGGFVFAAVTKYGFGDADLSFTRFNLDLRGYVPIDTDFTIAARVHGTAVSGTAVPTHARAYFGYGERIRGYYETVLEGEHLLGASMEIRYQLLKARTFEFTAFSLPSQFSVWRFGISLELFGDTGVAWFRSEPLQITDFSSGYGGGIVFLLPYSLVVRTEYAWNELGVGQFILGLKAPF